MNIDSKIAILCITTNGRSLACRIKRSLNYGDIYFINNKRGESLLDDNEVISKSLEEDIEIYTVKKRLKFFVEDIFDKYEYILFIMATGIVVRTIAPLITSKFSDPAILVTDEKGSNIISLLSGHMGGANEMTLHISDLINSNPVITTATDINKKSSLDMIAKKLNGHIVNFRDNVLDVNAMLVNGDSVGLYIDGEYNIDTRGFTVLDNSKSLESYISSDEELKKINLNTIVVISNKENLRIDKYYEDKYKIIKVTPRDIVIGIGCRRDTESHLLQDSLEDFLIKNNIDINSIKEIGSIEVKKDEKAIIDLSENLNVPFKVLSIEEISQVDYLFEKSEWVKKSVGVYSVAEPVAHLLSDGNLIIEKNKYKGITFSVGRLKI
ncbi:cobalt-precorrin 5A hydrolase [Romboutsia ilealis]|uniref:Cobalt-precorrin 5A hydrolase n=1 Tax=Romboutsia faecis TaxID=2764597 RepID=A0ABR7JTP0_9FIRM|nr:cobalt-precorrin 5A hydrolase [Romboutsia faecis]MBC5998275.1 cobalt-precorrin 5A hydrolase [Romboutsia faecis]MRN25937.1 cobalt-precorrin 5A hydrolase [Romboutsia ilealis]